MWLVNTGVKPPFFKVNRLKLQKLLKSIKVIKNYYAGQLKRKVNCDELSVEETLLGLPHIVKAASETWPNRRVKANFTLAWSFQQEPC